MELNLFSFSTNQIESQLTSIHAMILSLRSDQQDYWRKPLLTDIGIDSRSIQGRQSSIDFPIVLSRSSSGLFGRTIDNANSPMDGNSTLLGVSIRFQFQSSATTSK